VSGESRSSGFIVSLAVRTGSAPGDLEEKKKTITPKMRLKIGDDVSLRIFR
jgi:hypothetical protein